MLYLRTPLSRALCPFVAGVRVLYKGFVSSANSQMGINSLTHTTKTLLPGFGRPLNYVPNKSHPEYTGELFKNALSSADVLGSKIAYISGYFFNRKFTDHFMVGSLRMVTLREFAMLRFMNSITDKPEWHIKVLYLKSNIICLFNSLHIRSISKILQKSGRMRPLHLKVAILRRRWRTGVSTSYAIKPR